jgi:hypothetical protein
MILSLGENLMMTHRILFAVCAALALAALSPTAAVAADPASIW